MARSFFKRWTPTSESIKAIPALGSLSKYLHDPNLFHFNRRSVSLAFFWGMLIALIPMPGQMPVAAVAALMARSNLPITVALAWVSNPFTTPFFLIIIFQVGAFVLQSDYVFLTPEFSMHWLVHSLSGVWKPLLVGSVITGLLAGFLSYVIVRALWRWHVLWAWNRRKTLRAKA